MILANKRGLEGKETTAVAISFPFYQEVFGLTKSEQEKHLIGRTTHAEIDLMIILHKICNTNGRIILSNRHQIYHAYKQYFEKPCSQSQFYLAFDRFIKDGLIQEIEDENSGLSTFVLQHFQDEEGKLYRYVLVHPIVFTSSFRSLTLAARKLFLIVTMQQGKNKSLHLAIRGEKGLLLRLQKLQPVHLTKIISELKGENRTNSVFLKMGTLTKRRGIFSHAELALSDRLLISKAEIVREPLDPLKRYPRKVNFIKKVVTEMGIGEVADDLVSLIHSFKKLGYRVIRQVIRQLSVWIKENKRIPKDLASFVKKHTRIQREKEIIDLAHQYDLASYIHWEAKGSIRENAYFHFANRLCMKFSVKELRKHFKKTKQVIDEYCTYTLNAKLDDYHSSNELDSFKEIHVVRQYAYALKVDPTFYQALEKQASSLFRLGDNISTVCDWLLQRLDQDGANHPLPKRVHLEDTLEDLVIRIGTSSLF